MPESQTITVTTWLKNRTEGGSLTHAHSGVANIEPEMGTMGNKCKLSIISDWNKRIM